MASASSLLSDEQLLCSICLHVFSEPVSTACGHNFCLACITQHWDASGDVSSRCPLCKTAFNTRPELQVNALLSEICAPFKRSADLTEQECAEPAGALCDLCAGGTAKAVKSCLVCDASYCATHWEPHQTVPRLKTHLVKESVLHVGDRVCEQHAKPLEMFCQVDQVCVCQFCMELSHVSHVVVQLEEEYERRKAELEKTGDELCKSIQERRSKIQNIKQSVKLSKDAANKETTEAMKVFTGLMQVIERMQASFINTIQDKHKSVERDAAGFLADLENEIVALSKKRSELDKLSHTEDHLHFLQNIASLIAPVPTQNLTKMIVLQPPYRDTVQEELNKMENTLSMEVKQLSQQYASNSPVPGPEHSLSGFTGFGAAPVFGFPR